ncbi:MAG: HNH endonuclease [Deltaproteobacteria bacterium]|nr:MAG: HNH endonuclease [Deltaproteobacteria bacterium]
MAWKDDDTRLRSAAFAQVQRLQQVYDNRIPWQEISAGFDLGDGRRRPLATQAQGIYKPKGHPAALSIKTVQPRQGRTNPYSDTLAPDGCSLLYAYQARGGPDHSSNRSLRFAMEHQLPLIYFFGLEPGIYAAVLPMYVVGDDRTRQQFELVPGMVLASHETPTHTHHLLDSPPDRRYGAQLVLARLHQQSFRHSVLSAYQHHCAMCSIHFDEFLDAAHIVPDSDPLGVPDVRNGLALCGLHHRAFDRFLIDIDDDYRIELSPELLRRRDGPVFEQAFLERHRQPLWLPRDTRLRPAAKYLQARRRSRPPELWRS